MFTISYQGILTPKLTVEYLLAVVRWPLWPFLMVLNGLDLSMGGSGSTIQSPFWPQSMPQASQLCVCASENEVWTRGGLLRIVTANR